MKFAVPLGIFALLVVLLAVGLTMDPKKVPSPLVDKAAPEFELPKLFHSDQKVTNEDMLGQIWVLNVWASWCVSCRAEHKLITELAQLNLVNVVGLNYKDTNAEAIRWLDFFGNPYAFSLVDADGLTGIDYGVYGVPESFVIDGKGVIRHKVIGPVSERILRDELVPVLKQLLAEQKA